MSLLLLMALFAVVAAPVRAAGSAALVEDINTIREPALSANPVFPVTIGHTTYFNADDLSSGRELWKTDGTAAGTVLVKDIHPGLPESFPHNLIDVQGTLFFNAHDGQQPGLWRSNGTAAGTTLLKYFSWYTMSATNVNGTLFFIINDNTASGELWKSDGTPEGTVLVKDINPSDTSPHLTNLTNVGGTLFFTADDGISGAELWKSDGTATGTVPIKDINPGPADANPGGLTLVNGTLFFIADNGSSGMELWKTDGTAAGTVLVRDITPGGSTLISSLTAFNGTLMFVVEVGLKRELWRSDGTKNGTFPIASAPLSNLMVVNGVLLFTTPNTGNGPELWKSDGTAAGTSIIKQLDIGVPNSIIGGMADVGGKLFLTVGYGILGWELWKSDGTAAGTLPIKRIPIAENLVELNGILLFTARDAEIGAELWRSDGTPAGTGLLKDIAVDPGSSRPEQLTDVGGTLFFVADDGVSGKELWKTDGAGGAALVKDIFPGKEGSSPSLLTNLNGTLFFFADDGVRGQELWKSDGTAAGTTMVVELIPGLEGWLPGSMLQRNGVLFFSSYLGLWRSDGTAAGTIKIREKDSAWLTNVNGTLFFAAGNGTELWKSDGTAAGTTLVKDMGEIEYCGRFICRIPIAGGLTAVGNTLFFAGSNADFGQELWKSDGTAAGTTLVKDISAGPGGSYPEGLLNVGGTLFFVAGDAAAGRELWKSDGTAAGTTLVKDIEAGSGDGLYCYSVEPERLKNANGTLFFTAFDSAHGCELWKSDGTAAGTTLVKDVMPGVASSYPQYMAQVRPDGRVLFAAADGLAGVELWQTNGAEAGTVRVQDLAPGVANANPSSITAAGSRIFFVADDGASGAELWGLSADSLSAPIAYGTRLVVKVETTISGRLNAVDLEGDTLTYSIVANGAKGTAMIVDPATGAFTYTPNPGTSGNDSFTFQVGDGGHTSERATVDVTIAATVVYLPSMRR